MAFARAFANLPVHWTSESNCRSEGNRKLFFLRLRPVFFRAMCLPALEMSLSGVTTVRPYANQLVGCTVNQLRTFFLKSGGCIITKMKTRRLFIRWFSGNFHLFSQSPEHPPIFVKVILDWFLATAQQLCKLSPHFPQVNCHYWEHLSVSQLAAACMHSGGIQKWTCARQPFSILIPHNGRERKNTIILYTYFLLNIFDIVAIPLPLVGSVLFHKTLLPCCHLLPSYPA